MIVAKNIGRLGNNFFQIAAAIGVARRYGYQWGVDPSAGTGEPYSSIHRCYPNLPKGDTYGGQRYHEHPRGFCGVHGTNWDVCHYDYHEIPHLGPNVVLTGFFQSLKYFEHVQDEVKSVFQQPKIEGYDEYVSIHVRRGDYVQYAGSFPPITPEYVEKAIEHVPSKRFLVFSDDIAFCRSVWGDRFEYSEGRNEKEDLALMGSCGHHIIANSSFSWWGAYLGHNPNKVIVSPAQSGFNWFGPSAGVKNPKTLIPDGWVQIAFR